jgi:alpha-ketoglutarate-dependent taurine dioxygenase
MNIKPLTRDFVGEASGIDIDVPLTVDQVTGVDSGMNSCAGRVFRDQSLIDEQRYGYSRGFGALAGRCRKLAHPPTTFTEHATQPQFTHAHQWQVNERVMWDNRTMIRGV